VFASQQIRASFEKVKVRIHGLLLVHVDAAQSLLARQRPVSLEGLEIASMERIVAHGFDHLEEAQRPD